MGKFPPEDDHTLYRIVYDSVALLPFGEAGTQELKRLVDHSQRRNALSNVTGVLRYDGASFMQVLEGPRAVVVAMMKRIQRDARHTGIRILEIAPLRQRDFASWSMALLTDGQTVRTDAQTGRIRRDAPAGVTELVGSLRAMLDARTG